MTALWFGIAVLAVYRFAHALSLESVPGEIFNKAREWVTNRFGYVSWQSEFMRCPLCQGFWLSLLMAILLYAGELSFGLFLMAWWGIAGGMTVLHIVLYRLGC